jgi:hypothetical protein
MSPLRSLREACVPRKSVFEQRARDTVYNIDDLAEIDPGQFFAENFVTEGMKVLLTEAFKRLEGESSSAGAFLLSQSMGGGKTHNLIALGLLARFPSLRTSVMGEFYTPGPLGAVRVVTFSGRHSNTPFGVWGELAEQLGRKEVFADFYGPLKPPGDGDWVRLLSGGPCLLLLDELPPYFEAARAYPVGNTTLDTITTTAIANLLVAVNSGKLPNVCMVLTDLGGAAYSAGTAAITEALSNLQKEVNRDVPRIDPVQINTNELYQILQTRLFESLPPDGEREAVADAYRQELERARLMEITAASPEQLKADIARTYPFHPAIRDLYARFKENPGFQQTRALIRIMRLIVADLWSSGGGAAERHLIGAHDLDLHEQDVLGEVRQINNSLDAAVAHDIASDGDSAVAEVVDGGGASDAQDAARLIFLSSLSQAVNPTLGLERSEVVRYLAAPGRDLVGLNAAIDRLQTEAWYLHPTRDGKLLFKNTENLVAKLDTYTKGMIGEQRREELRERLGEMFRPELGVLYQRVEALPALDQVELGQDEVTLVIFRPSSIALGEIRRFWEHQQYKNRALFLTGNAAAFETALLRAAELRAIKAIVREMRDEGKQDTDPQVADALTLLTRKEAGFFRACRETFQSLHYPARNGLAPLELDLKFLQSKSKDGLQTIHAIKGEEQIVSALTEVSKFHADTGPESPFRSSLENKLWPESVKEMPWSDLKRRAATDPSWVWHHPRALDNLKAELVKRDVWRESGGYVQRGPFPQPATAVSVQVLSRNEETGEVTLRVRPLHGTVVYKSDNGRSARPRSSWSSTTSRRRR